MTAINSQKSLHSSTVNSVKEKIKIKYKNI